MITYNGVTVLDKFPNNETRIESDKVILNTKKENLIVCRYGSDEDLIGLMLLKDFLDVRHINCELLLPYVPYSRMDRTENGSAFTLRGVCSFINSLGFSKVHIIEPHSDVTPALLDNVEVHYATPYLFKMAATYWEFSKNHDVLFFPDAGAKKRYEKLFPSLPYLYGDKTRDFATGKITSLNVIGDTTKLRTVYIIDDICAYGGTFILAAEKLLELGASGIILIVAHCEESYFKGKIPGSDSIQKVFSLDSLYQLGETDKLHLYSCDSILERI